MSEALAGLTPPLVCVGDAVTHGIAFSLDCHFHFFVHSVTSLFPPEAVIKYIFRLH